MFAVRATGFTRVQFAYDVKRRREVPFEEMKETMAASIREAYGLGKDGKGRPIDPLEWAWSYRGEMVFSKLHPEAISK